MQNFLKNLIKTPFIKNQKDLNGVLYFNQYDILFTSAFEYNLDSN